jgi:hypothetical protein
MAWLGLIWFRLGKVSSSDSTGIRLPFPYTCEISWLVEELVAVQEGHSNLELISSSDHVGPINDS